jgi:hypothetical protein
MHPAGRFDRPTCQFCFLGIASSFSAEKRPSWHDDRGRVASGINKMKKTALLMLLFCSVSSPLMAKPHHSHHHSRDFSHHASRQNHESRHHSDHPAIQQTHSHITCDMVRSYVAQVGLAQAKAMAQAAGMTVSEERRAGSAC